jgi:hypothetical protein
MSQEQIKNIIENNSAPAQVPMRPVFAVPQKTAPMAVLIVTR